MTGILLGWFPWADLMLNIAGLVICSVHYRTSRGAIWLVAAFGIGVVARILSHLAFVTLDAETHPLLTEIFQGTLLLEGLLILIGLTAVLRDAARRPIVK